MTMAGLSLAAVSVHYLRWLCWKRQEKTEKVEWCIAWWARSRSVLPMSAADKGKESTHSLPFSVYCAPSACGKTRVVLQNLQPKREPTEMGVAYGRTCRGGSRRRPDRADVGGRGGAGRG